jgi:hypothetical protein
MGHAEKAIRYYGLPELLPSCRKPQEWKGMKENLGLGLPKTLSIPGCVVRYLEFDIIRMKRDMGSWA